VTLTVRDDRVMRVLARDHEEVDDGWLCDKGRYAFQYAHVDERISAPLVREGINLHPASWEKALSLAAAALKKAGGKAAALAGGDTTNEEAFLLARLFREGIGSERIASGSALPLELYHPGLGARVSDLEWAHTVLLLDTDPIDEATIWDLRLRKGARRHKVGLAIASARPTALDAHARQVLRIAPGRAEALLVALDAALSGDDGNLGGGASAAGTNAATVRDLAQLLRDGGEEVVIVASERRLTAGSAAALLNVASRLGLAGREGAGLLIAPNSANGRGLREVGLAGTQAEAVSEALRGGDASVLYLLHADPLREERDREGWKAAMTAAQTVIAHESVMTETIREHADIVFPAEAYPEKEGTITHPDGLVQRLRIAIGRPAEVRATWSVIAEVSARAGLDQRVRLGPMVSQQLFDAVPRYRGLTLDVIGGRGARPDPEAVEGSEAWQPVKLKVPKAAPATRGGALRLGTFRPLWASKEVEVSPALRFAVPRQVVELSPADAERLGIVHGSEVEVASNGHRLHGAAVVRAAVPAGTVFVAEGLAEESGNLLTEPVVRLRRTGEWVDDMPLPPAAASATPGDVAVAAPQGDEEGIGVAAQPPGDVATHPAQDAAGDQTEDAPKPRRRRKKDSGPDKATGGGA
jgi:NADH-quinone oxidoreductase subunit G